MAFKDTNVTWRYIQREDFGKTLNTDENNQSESDYVFETNDSAKLKWSYDESDFIINNNDLLKNNENSDYNFIGKLYDINDIEVKNNNIQVETTIKHNYIKQNSNELTFTYQNSVFYDTNNKIVDINNGNKITNIKFDLNRYVKTHLYEKKDNILIQNVDYYLKDGEYNIYDVYIDTDVETSEILKGYVKIFHKDINDIEYPLYLYDNYYSINNNKIYFVEDSELFVNYDEIPLIDKEWKMEIDNSNINYDIPNINDEINIDTLFIKYSCTFNNFIFESRLHIDDSLTKKIKILQQNVLKGIDISLSYKTKNKYDTYILEKERNIYQSQNYLDTDKMSFSYMYCLSGTTYRYITNHKDIYDKNYIDGDGKSFVNYYNEYDLIDNEIKNSIIVDFVIDANYNIFEKINKIYDDYVNINSKVLMINQDNLIENGIYIKTTNGILKKTNDLDTVSKSEKSNSYCRYGKFKNKQFFLEPDENGVYPTTDEEKRYTIKTSLILKNVIDYELDRNDAIKPKLIFVDEYFAKKQDIKAKSLDSIIIKNFVNIKSINIINEENENEIFYLTTELDNYTFEENIILSNINIEDDYYSDFEMFGENLVLNTFDEKVKDLFDLTINGKYKNKKLMFKVKEKIDTYKYNFLEFSTTIQGYKKTLDKNGLVVYSIYIDNRGLSKDIINKFKHNDIYEATVSNLEYLKLPVSTEEINTFKNNFKNNTKYIEFVNYFDFIFEENDLIINIKEKYKEYSNFKIKLTTYDNSVYISRKNDTNLNVDTLNLKDASESDYINYDLYNFMKNALNDNIPNDFLNIPTDSFDNELNNDVSFTKITLDTKQSSDLSDQQTGVVMIKILKEEENIFKENDIIEIFYDSNVNPLITNINILETTNTHHVLYINIDNKIMYDNGTSSWIKSNLGVSMTNIDKIKIEKDIFRISKYIKSLKKEHVLRNNVCLNITNMLIGEEEVRKNFTGLIYQNKEYKYKLNIFDEWENDKKLLYKPFELIKIGGNKKTSIPQPLEYLSITNDIKKIDYYYTCYIDIPNTDENDVFLPKNIIKIDYLDSNNDTKTHDTIIEYVRITDSIKIYLSLPVGIDIQKINKIYYNMSDISKTIDYSEDNKIFIDNIVVYLSLSFPNTEANKILSIGNIIELDYKKNTSNDVKEQYKINDIKYYEKYIEVLLNSDPNMDIESINKLTICSIYNKNIHITNE